ncbi:MAG: ribosome recycling factor [Planctomycetes bacterium]|nr:ribosome recycling factor [Planctomycetota bacterium]MCB9909459.1 ribosome recycling factor [Planctomycetota bacterium]HPF13854.1 ribosome recycling factor [Planctomycetota bacterium]HRV82790.1 ribosome recycling factor [Planctomycetota bacterium]
MSQHPVLKETSQRMEKALAHTQDMLRTIRTSRASSALVDNIRVDYYGTPSPLSQVAQISVPEPRQLMIKPFDMSILKEIEKALQKSDLGITPESDGKVIRLNLPPLSGDQRRKYAAKAKDLCEEGRVALRNLRRDANKEVDALLKSKDMTEDDNKALHDEIQELLKQYEAKVGDLQERKNKEIMEV